MKMFPIAIAAAVLAAAPAQADVVTVLPGGTAQPIPPVPTSSAFTSGPRTFGDITYNSTTSNSVFGYTGSYGYGGNGFRNSGAPMAGLNTTVGAMNFTFAAPVRGVLANIRWAIGGTSGGQAITAQIFNSGGSLLETLTFSANGNSNAIAEGSWGFSRSQNDIASLRLSNGFITAENFQTLAGAVPEPGTWAMMILGFGVIGGAMRSRRRQTVRFVTA